MSKTIPREEIMGAGHLACQGCGATILMRHMLKALGRDVCLDIPACCWSVIDGPFPHSAVNVPLFHTAFETAAATADRAISRRTECSRGRIEPMQPRNAPSTCPGPAGS